MGFKIRILKTTLDLASQEPLLPLETMSKFVEPVIPDETKSRSEIQ